jgi:hypothetical protein
MTTNAQQAKIEYLKEKFAPRDGYEVKEEKVEDAYGGQVFFYLTTGLIGDEGTMAELYARTRRWFCIGKRGATKSFADQKWHNDIFRTW